MIQCGGKGYGRKCGSTYGVEESFVRLCKGLYEGMQASVQVDG